MGAAAEDDRVAATAAARELSHQLFVLQNTMANIPGPPMGRELYRQCEQVQNYLKNFRQQLKRPVSREQLTADFDKMDATLERLLDDVKGFTQWDVPMRGVVRQVRAAAHDLQFAVAAGDGSGVGIGPTAYGQALALMTRGENFAAMVKYVFDEQDSLKSWSADLANFARAGTNLKRLEASQAPPNELRSELLETERAWDKVVVRVKMLPEGQYLLLRRQAAQVDEILSRLARIHGIQNRRAPLVDPFALEEPIRPK